MNRTSGMTLMELIIATLILSVAVMAAVWSFQYISMSIQHSKTRTLSTNLGQEQIEKLKNLSYYSLLVTTSPIPDPHITSITYDPGFYPPATIIEGGIPFTRGTRVDVALQSGTNITLLPPSAEDTGLKQITVYTIWQEGGNWQYKEIHNLMANPATSPLNATLTGHVTKAAGGANIANVLVQSVDNPQFYAYTNSAGVYSFTVSEGSYTLRASSQGYFTKDTPGYISVTSANSAGYDFSLVTMSSGTVSGYVYKNDHLVITTVVASTGPSNTIEYVTLYNPTTAAIFIGDTAHDGESGHAMPAYVPVIWGINNSIVNAQRLHYINSTVPSHGNYLISNTGNADPATTCATFTISGTAVQPDACWNHVYYLNSGHEHAIECGNSCPDIYQPDAGGVSLVQAAGLTSSFNLTASWLSYRTDSVGWNQKSGGVGNAAPSNAVEGTAITPLGVPNGIIAGEIIGRMTDPGFVSSGGGMSYDTDNNFTNFLDSATIPGPPSTTAAVQAPYSGTPAAGAVVNFNDPLSNTAVCNSLGFFSAPGVATGTWTMNVSSGNLFAQVTNVLMPTNISTAVPNGITSPTWATVGNRTNTLLSDTTIYGFVSGYVTDGNLGPINHIKVVDSNGRYTFTSTTGKYMLLASTGIPVQITANPSDSSMNKSYVTTSLSSQTLAAGTLYDEVSWPLAPVQTTDFILPYAGILVGYYKTASNTSIPGRVGVALDPSTCSGNPLGQGVSDSTGHFYLLNLATGTYCIQPSLDPAESASPPNYPSVVLASTGTSLSYSTFTITSGLSEITGQATITASTRAITTGVLVVASTVSLGVATLPPPVSGATGMLCSPCYYAASSDATGTYSLNVRSASTPYYVYGWYGRTRSGPYSVTVSTAGQIYSRNLSW